MTNILEAPIDTPYDISGVSYLSSLYVWPDDIELQRDSVGRAVASARVPLRMGRGAGPAGLALRVIPFENRLDWRPAEMTPSTLVWMVKDIFATQDGSWEVDLSKRFGIDQWARDAYLRPSNDPMYYPDGGGDHHIHVVAYNSAGAPYVGAGYMWTSDGVVLLQPPADPARVITRNSGTPHGWANIPIFGGNCSPPAILGPWAVGKLAMASDLVVGVGLPDNHHVSTFVVYETKTWAEYQAVTPPPPPGPDPVDPAPTVKSKLQIAADLAETMAGGTRAPDTIVNRVVAIVRGLENEFNDE